MDQNGQKLRTLETLVEELLKDDPTESVVEKCMIEVGIPDSKDPIDRINKVLLALHFEEAGKDFVE